MLNKSSGASAIRSKITPKELTDVWALKHGVYVKQVDAHTQQELKLTSSQKKMVARHAKNLRVTANARSKYLSTHYLELASACESAITKKRAQLDKLKAEIVASSTNTFLKPEALKKKTQQITKLKVSFHQMSNRLQRLRAAAVKQQKLSESGLTTMCFGGRKLASAVHRLDEESSPYKSKESWEKAWREARDQSWLFDGDKSANGSNKNIKWDPDSKTLKVRITDDQALGRMKVLALELGMTLEELLNEEKTPD